MNRNREPLASGEGKRLRNLGDTKPNICPAEASFPALHLPRQSTYSSFQLFQDEAVRECLDACNYYKSPVGMSRAHGAIQLQSPEMGEQKLQRGVPKQSLDEATIASKGVGNQRHRSKQNLDYVLRTGLAGGLAGCAVCALSPCRGGPR